MQVVRSFVIRHQPRLHLLLAGCLPPSSRILSSSRTLRQKPAPSSSSWATADRASSGLLSSSQSMSLVKSKSVSQVFSCISGFGSFGWKNSSSSLRCACEKLENWLVKMTCNSSQQVDASSIAISAIQSLLEESAIMSSETRFVTMTEEVLLA